jgi:hypothetical protein
MNTDIFLPMYNPQANTNPLPLINEEFAPLVYTAAAATGIAALSLLGPCEAVRIIGMTVLTGVGYGIANDMFACRDCIEYFTVGHIYDGRNLENRPLNTLDPNLNALAWGAIATWHVCALAGVLFATIAQAPIPGLALKISAIQLAPIFAIGAAITLLVSHVRSRMAQQAMESNPHHEYWFVPLEFQAGWEACNVRNLTAYLSLGIGAIALSVATVVARTGIFIPL